jgi:hypothetical protein
MRTTVTSFLLVFFLALTAVCGYRTSNVIIIVIDGARYTETFGDSTHQLIPRIWNDLRPRGTIYTRFYNDSITYTCSGHGTILTGAWQILDDAGMLRPFQPTVFEYFRKEWKSPVTESYVILGKPKLYMLSYGTGAGYGADYGASVIYCNDYYDDRLTWANVDSVLSFRHPRLAIVNLGQVDAYGHLGGWAEYCASIQRSDSITGLTWDLIQRDPFYRDRTTLFVVNDHGRHTVDFMSHGDRCEGCRHIMCLMIGPDAAAGMVDSAYRRQIDIAPTIGELLDFSTPFAEGRSMVPVLPPKPPFTLDPPQDAADLMVPVRLQWQPSHRTVFYRIQVARDSGFRQPVIEDTTGRPEYSAMLDTSSTYFWRISANNAAGSSAWSAAALFATGSIPAPLASPEFPLRASVVASATVDLRWSISSGRAEKFWLQIGTDSLLSETLYSDSSIRRTSETFRIPLNRVGYWWRVRAAVTGGWTPWSEPSMFVANIRGFAQVSPEDPCSFEPFVTGKWCNVRYRIADHLGASLSILDIAGRRCRMVRLDRTAPGYYAAQIDLDGLPMGNYLLEFRAGAFSKYSRVLVF